VKPRLLVASSVHPPDDPRIREKLIRSLSRDFEIVYATQEPGPNDRSDLEWVPLVGTRNQRRRAVGSLLADDPYDIAVIHDPELLPSAIKQSRRGRTVVYDVHENLPAQIESRTSIPSPMRRPLAALAHRYLLHAERQIPMTLAESGYGSMFASGHPVIPNYPRMEGLPKPGGDPDGPIIYVGDVTEVRGITTLIEAVGLMDHVRKLVVVGRYSTEFGRKISTQADQLGVDLDLTGWLEHGDAMELVVRSSIGVSPLFDTGNYRHSLPTKTLEYLALGVPVVASDLPGTRSVIGGMRGVFLVQPGNAIDLARALDRAVEAEESGRPDSEVIREGFVWHDSEVRDFYRSLLP
jgi:glycosyltransferase involved in cell wall biosynthesis